MKDRVVAAAEEWLLVWLFGVGSVVYKQHTPASLTLKGDVRLAI
jgi:hypothetical protein